LIQQQAATEKMKAKYEFEIEDLNLKKTTNELLQH